MTVRIQAKWVSGLLSFVVLLGAALGTDENAKDAPRTEALLAGLKNDEEILEEAPLENVRFFKEVYAKEFSTVHRTLARLGRNGDFVLLIETDARRNPISDTMLVWVQHHDAQRAMNPRAQEADLIIACYPELASQATRARHVLPTARGKVWTYFIKGRYLIVSDRRYPMLDFALKSL